MTTRKGIVVVGDLHIDEASIDEVKNIVEEICAVPAKSLIQLGDLCHNNRLNARELEFLTWVAYRFKTTFEEVHFITGNHDLLDNSVSTISYLKYMNINIHNTDEKNIANILAGHFFTDKSKDAFGKYKYSLEEFRKNSFDYCFLGHQHDFQKLDDGIYHLGSARYVSFAENEKEKKKIAWLHDGILDFVELNNCLPIYNIYKYESLYGLNSNSKIRYIISSFDQLRNEIEKLKSQKAIFKHFKIMLAFTKKTKTVEAVKEKTDIKNFVNNWLKSIEDKDIRNILEEEFTQEIK